MDPKTESPELIGLRVNETAFAASVKQMEANPNRSEKVLAEERNNLENVQKRIAELTS